MTTDKKMRNESVIFPHGVALAEQARELLKCDILSWPRVRLVLSHSTYVLFKGTSPFAIPQANQDGNLRYSEESFSDDGIEQYNISRLHIPLCCKESTLFAGLELCLSWLDYYDCGADTTAVPELWFKLKTNDPWSKLEFHPVTPTNLCALLEEYASEYVELPDDRIPLYSA